jgi:NAD-dependent deacetylase
MILIKPIDRENEYTNQYLYFYLILFPPRMEKQKIVVFTGAGMSAESGLKTFRDSGGLLENHKIEEVATPEAWNKNPSLVLDFYNQRRKQCIEASPNAAHVSLLRLEELYDVQIITQNIDDLHERAGSKNILHLHGEIRKARSTHDDSLIYTLKGDAIRLGDVCEKGSQLRPHIVWFGEQVPMMYTAINLVSSADILIIIGTSLSVYPAARLIEYAPKHATLYYIDPNATTLKNLKTIHSINTSAVKGLVKLVDKLLTKC